MPTTFKAREFSCFTSIAREAFDYDMNIIEMELTTNTYTTHTHVERSI